MEEVRRRNKIRMAIEALIPGLVIAEPVMNDYGAVVAWQDTTLDDLLIRRMSSMGITHLLVYTQDVQQRGTVQRETLGRTQTAEKFQRSYEHGTLAFRDMFLNLADGGEMDLMDTNHIVEGVLRQQDDYQNIVDCVMQVRSADEYTYHHCVNVAMLSMMMGKWMRVPEVDLPELIRAGLLHDVGKSRIPLSILNKPGALTAPEFAEMKRHAEYGYQLIKETPGLRSDVSVAVLTHHEREDGTGYPLGLQANKLSLFSKVLAVADVFDAMTANRVYRPKESVFRVFELMQHGSFGKLDPIVLRLFLQKISHFYVGRQVKLSDGRRGEIIFMNQMDFSRPVIQTEKGFIDLMSDKVISIVGSA